MTYLHTPQSKKGKFPMVFAGDKRISAIYLFTDKDYAKDVIHHLGVPSKYKMLSVDMETFCKRHLRFYNKPDKSRKSPYDLVIINLNFYLYMTDEGKEKAQTACQEVYDETGFEGTAGSLLEFIQRYAPQLFS